MDYSKLSRESLLHEIEQLNMENEHIKLKNIGSQLGIRDSLNDIKAPVFIVNSDYNVVWANHFCAENFNEILVKKCYQVFFNNGDVCMGCQVQQCLMDGKQNDLIVARQLNEGLKEISVKLIPLVRDERIFGVLEIQSESENNSQKQIHQFDQLQKLENINEMLTKKQESLAELVEHFSKSIKVPLRSFIGYFQAFSHAEDESVKTEYLSLLKMNSELLYETLNKLMMITRYDTRNYVGKRESFNFRKIIEETLNQIILPQSETVKSNFNLQYTETLPDVLIGDAFSLRMLIAYLLEFAVQVSNNEMLEIRVSDITQTHSKMVLKISMQSQYRCESNIKQLDYYNIELNTQFESILEYSLALGLKLAKELVKIQNGMIDINVGLDSLLYIDVTLNYDKVIPKYDQLPEVDHNMRKKVLIADVEKPYVSLEIFKNYDIYFAHNGNEAIKQYFLVEPDLTIVNVLIEDCDGFKVYDEIERRRKKISPIVAISSKLIDNEREFMRDYGFDEYYPKPLNDEKLQGIIENYF
ncbi:response regulator [Fusibacter bizertensis]